MPQHSLWEPVVLIGAVMALPLVFSGIAALGAYLDARMERSQSRLAQTYRQLKREERV